MSLNFYADEMRECFGKTLLELGEMNPKVIVLDSDLHTSSRLEHFKKRFPDRFIQCGIAESNMFGIAAGLASEGWIPFPSTFAAFAVRKALDQVYLNIAYPKNNVKIAGSYVGMTATECGPSHNVGEDLAVMRALPYIRVAAPGDNHELRSLMFSMLAEEGPVYFRVPRCRVPRLFDESFRYTWGKSNICKEGSDISLYGTGIMTGILLSAAQLLAKQGISAEVIHMASIKPIDEAQIQASAQKTGMILSLENGRIFGGFGSAIAEVSSRLCPIRVESMGIGDTVIESAPLPDLIRQHHLTPEDVAERAASMLHSKKTADKHTSKPVKAEFSVS